MTVDASPWYNRNLFLPLSLVANIDRREVCRMKHVEPVSVVVVAAGVTPTD